MLSERSLAALEDMLDNICLAQEFTSNVSLDALAADRRTFYAVVRCLEIISEAARRLDVEVVERHPEIPWRDLRGAGNVYRHDYGNVSPRTVLRTAREALPILRAAVEAELAGSSGLA